MTPILEIVNKLGILYIIAPTASNYKTKYVLY